MKKRLIGLVLVLACLCVGVSVGSAQATYCTPQDDTGGFYCYTAKDAYDSGYNAGYSQGYKSTSAAPSIPKVPSEYSKFATDWRSGYSKGWYDGHSDKKKK